MTESALSRRRALAFALGAPVGLGWLGAAQAAPQPQPPPDYSVVLDRDGKTVARTGGARRSQVTAQVVVNGQGPFTFLVDTGANRSAVSESLAAHLGLPLGPSVRVHTIVGVSNRPTVWLDELSIGGRAQYGVRAPTLTMTGVGVDGVLGVDWLRNRRMTIFFEEQRLEITGSSSLITIDDEDRARPKVTVPARLEAGQLTIIDTQLGRRRIISMIDTGSNFTLGNQPLRALVERQAGGAVVTRRVGITTVTGEGGVGDLVYVPSVRVGGVMFMNVPIVFSDLPMFSLWGMQDQPGVVLGLDMISQFKALTLDFGRRQVRFEVGATPDLPAGRQVDGGRPAVRERGLASMALSPNLG